MFTINVTPEILYKYRSFDARSISMLENDQVWFSSPLDFNDPFDCRVQENCYDNIDSKNLSNFLIQQGVLAGEITDENLKAFVNELNYRILPVKDNDTKNLNTLFETLGIFSLSECIDSILMWSHYSDYHRGFCIGFKPNLFVFEDPFLKVHYPVAIEQDIFQLHDSMNELTYDQKIKKLFYDFFLTKHPSWSYENEWRVIGRKGVEKYARNVIDSVIFGLLMPEEHKITIMQILKESQIKFFQAKKSKIPFSIDIVQIA